MSSSGPGKEQTPHTVREHLLAYFQGLTPEEAASPTLSLETIRRALEPTAGKINPGNLRRRYRRLLRDQAQHKLPEGITIPKILTPKEHLLAYFQGLTPEEAADETFSLSDVYRRLRQNNVSVSLETVRRSYLSLTADLADGKLAEGTIIPKLKKLPVVGKRAEVIRRLMEGESVTRIMQELGVRRGYAGDIRHLAGLANKRQPFSAEELSQIKDLWNNQQLTRDGIISSLRETMSPQRVRAAIEQLRLAQELTPRRPKNEIRKRDDLIIDLTKQGMPLAYIRQSLKETIGVEMNLDVLQDRITKLRGRGRIEGYKTRQHFQTDEEYTNWQEARRQEYKAETETVSLRIIATIYANGSPLTTQNIWKRLQQRYTTRQITDSLNFLYRNHILVEDNGVLSISQDRIVFPNSNSPIEDTTRERARENALPRKPIPHVGPRRDQS